MQDPADIKQVSAIQDKIKIRQEDHGEFVLTNYWDRGQMLAMRTNIKKKKMLKALAVRKCLARKARSVLR